MTCSVPRILGFRKWFEKRFGDLCHKHDEGYMLRTRTKLEIDAAMVGGMWVRGYRLLAVGAFLVFQSPIAYYKWYK